MERLPPNRHERGWPKYQLLTFVIQYPCSERFCIEPMGLRDTVWERCGYVELIRFHSYNPAIAERWSMDHETSSSSGNPTS